MKKWHVILLTSFLLVTPFSAITVKAEEGSGKSPYEIYPLPQNETDLGTAFTLTDEVNVVVEESIDEPTRKFLKEILTSASIGFTISEETVSDRTNILIGIKGSNGYVDTYFNDHIQYDSTIFKEIDPYVLTIDKQLEEMGSIAILGEDTDAAYYGLESLKMIMDQLADKKVHSMRYEDYADTKWRGFIEGFYGFPWSHEARKSLMEYGGSIKMNAYIYGPKNEKYHNSEWRKLYPEEELAKIEDLAQTGYETKTEFIWAIHPGFNMIDWNNYDQEMEKLFAKFEQMYGAGVRQFGLFMDDISTAQALKDKDKHVKLITDIANWVETKGDVKPLVYTPPFYNQSWTGSYGKPYLEALRDVPENVEIMWTGSGVAGTVNEQDMQWVKDIIGRDPFVWLNWPVNDYVNSRLMLGKGEVLEPGTHNISGVVSNPMRWAELSKIALFAVADFTWNVDAFDAEQSWLDSFDYIAPNVASELNTIAYHLSDPSPSTHGLVVGESENIKEELNTFRDKFANGESVEAVGQQLMDEFDKILEAINGFREKSTNEQMVKEITPWLHSLENVVKADKHAVQSVLALQNEDMNTAWEALGEASAALTASKTFTIKKLNSPDVTVEAGAKRLVPFAKELINKLDAKIYQTINPGATVRVPITSYNHSDLGAMVDGDPESLTYIKTLQENGDWYGVDLGKKVPVTDIHILQGRNNDDHDIFHKGILEYSTDGESWTAIGEERSGYKVEADHLELEARYIRYRLTHAGVPGGKPDLWTAIREFTVNKNSEEARFYSNIDGLQAEVESTTTEASLKNLSEIMLRPSEYVGIALPGLEKIKSIELDRSTTDATLQVSENGVEWEEISKEGPYPNAAYVRLINNTEEEITFDLPKLQIAFNKFVEPTVSHNYESIYQGKQENLYDGDLTTKTWFGGMQDKGKYVQVDMGGLVDVNDIALVINDGEGDYFRKGDLQISEDGETWETIHSFENPGDRSLNFPDHEVPYRYKRVEVGGQQARYIRLISTESHQMWLGLNEIIVNEGMEKPGPENLAVQAEPKGTAGNEEAHVIDGKLATFYTPKGDAQAGQLIYKLTQETKVGELLILQNPQAISNAEVSIRDLDGWHKVGSLSQSLTELDTSRYEHVLEVRVEWAGDVKPQIHEIIPVSEKVEEPVVASVADVKALVKQFAEVGEITDEEAVRRLDMHLTTVERFEKDENVGKLVKHLQGFKQMIAYYYQQGQISDLANAELDRAADVLIGKYE
ncbi:beta-N-acetylglucosaminidase domain-containing protein [Virgibacillus halodenitrificans]|uniref:beta-N-acetylglucosaminidase domain-containing protein n=1 Tax=Virgibacillus halodenitrificans TaxID=1482 RepID=UPI002DBE13A3|nr:beta-N-acetylglucosaminidase domain-containing protein [Virgibacillus halodenitrificans]MEC2159640.1 beta-N-acetylglucosaminidase domain-containing protein [Virgibacillus halodenitrificans]